ncbi:MAG: type VI secretion protein [Sphingomonadaceae bacterium]|nr:type VI secretion protein [Sphingomonadaceae bacterium]
MAPNAKLHERQDPADERDPRDGVQEGAQVIDLATRSVLPAVSQRKRGDGLGMAAGVLVIAGLGAVTLWSMDSARRSDAAIPAKRQQDATSSQVAAAQTPRPDQLALGEPNVQAAPVRSPVLAKPPRSANLPLASSNPYASPTIIFDAGALKAPSAALTSPITGKGNSNDDFAARLGGVGGSRAVAQASFDPATTVTQGTLIPAVLETAIDTDVPGYVRAIVSTDVRSFDGARVLVPRSSRLIGQYKSGLSAGQKRAYVIWTRLIRPDGVSVNIGSPAIGFNGETGLAGKVNSHFFQRFGSAMLLSVVGGLATLRGNASVIVGGGGQSAAAAAIGQTGQIGPTIRVRQGEPIRVFTARDLDFSKVS